MHYTPNTNVRIYYQVEEIRNGEIEAENYYMAVINKQYFHFYSDTFFILPSWDLNQEYDIRIAWDHMPSNWNLANSFGVNQKIQDVKIPLWKFRHAVFAGGDYRIHQRMIGQSPVYFAIRGKWNFPEDQLCDFSTNIFNAEKNFGTITIQHLPLKLFCLWKRKIPNLLNQEPMRFLYCFRRIKYWIINLSIPSQADTFTIS